MLNELKYNSEIFHLFNDINNPNIFKLRIDGIFCPKEKCIFYDNKFAYIFDNAHATYKGSKLINDLIIKEIEQIETK